LNYIDILEMSPRRSSSSSSFELIPMYSSLSTRTPSEISELPTHEMSVLPSRSSTPRNQSQTGVVDFPVHKSDSQNVIAVGSRRSTPRPSSQNQVVLANQNQIATKSLNRPSSQNQVMLANQNQIATKTVNRPPSQNQIATKSLNRPSSQNQIATKFPNSHDQLILEQQQIWDQIKREQRANSRPSTVSPTRSIPQDQRYSTPQPYPQLSIDHQLPFQRPESQPQRSITSQSYVPIYPELNPTPSMQIVPIPQVHMVPTVIVGTPITVVRHCNDMVISCQ
jgi:hypothetical protein